MDLRTNSRVASLSRGRQWRQHPPGSLESNTVRSSYKLNGFESRMFRYLCRYQLMVSFLTSNQVMTVRFRLSAIYTTTTQGFIMITVISIYARSLDKLHRGTVLLVGYIKDSFYYGPLAQQIEHNPFKIGVIGAAPIWLI